MPKPRLTIVQAEMRGSAAKDPKRFKDRKNAPKPGGVIGDPPVHLDDNQRDIWNEIAALIPEGVAGAADRITLEIATQLTWELRQDPAEMGASRIALLSTQLGKLGLDPQSRTKMQVAPDNENEEKNDKWGFLN